MLSRRNRILEKSDNLIYDEAFSDSISEKIMAPVKPKKKSLDDVISHLDETFSETLLRIIDERGLKDPEVYKKANVTKQTVLAFAIALQLNLDEAKDLLLKSGYALSRSNKFDVLISFFIETENYDIYEINAVLFEYDQNLLGV